MGLMLWSMTSPELQLGARLPRLLITKSFAPQTVRLICRYSVETFGMHLARLRFAVRLFTILLFINTACLFHSELAAASVTEQRGGRWKATLIPL